MMRPFRVVGSQGVTLAGVEAGPVDGAPLVFVHGFAQDHRSFQRTLMGPLADRFRLIAFDLRGHGGSDRPEPSAAYSEGARWAEDLEAVLRARGAERPVIVAWSYGGIVVGDYLRHAGGDALGGVVFVGAPLGVGRASKPWLGSAMLTHTRAMLADAAPERVAATHAFLAACSAAPLDDEARDLMIAMASAIPPHVRRGMFARNESYENELRALRRPVLALHGARDEVILPAASEHVTRTVSGARAIVYDDVGHMPFIERPRDFERDLAAFADSVGEGAKRAAT
ncbi:Biotin synthesis protein BioH [Minicystis rosea]|nr:Biotin synthesis protein BioH [Minicystis rosea]